MIIKVRAKLLSKQQAMERSEKAKKQREMKKYGKKVWTVLENSYLTSDWYNQSFKVCWVEFQTLRINRLHVVLPKFFICIPLESVIQSTIIQITYSTVYAFEVLPCNK